MYVTCCDGCMLPTQDNIILTTFCVRVGQMLSLENIKSGQLDPQL